MFKFLKVLLLFFACTINSQAISPDDPLISEFIEEMSGEHTFEAGELRKVFSQVQYSQSVLDAISRPAEKKLTWHRYRQIFFDGKRDAQGVEFWKKHEKTLARAYEKYGVPPEIIVAIIGVETRYGRITGNYKVMNSLSTLAFRYPKRAKFFRGQLKEFLLLSREQNIDPMSSTGSYAGAMGIPQFIPSSYRHYAVDFDDDGFIDIWSNPVDAIGSVANYFSVHGWKKGGVVTVKASVSGDEYKNALEKGLDLTLNKSDLERYSIRTESEIKEQTKYKLLELEQENGFDYWLALDNFYVITRYNHSILYAMAVFQLSEAIRAEYQKAN